MAHGGPRGGAGRKPGAVNRATAEAREKAQAEGGTPLDFMLARMWDQDAPIGDRMDAAKAAAPYVHAKLASVDATLKADVNATIQEIRNTIVDPRHTDSEGL